MSLNSADGMANSVDPDQIGAVWFGSALFAQAYLSKNLGSLRYSEHFLLYSIHFPLSLTVISYNMDRVKWIWYLSPMRAAKVQASLRIHCVSPEPSLLAHTSSESRGTFRQKARSLAPLNGWACAVKICNDGMLEDTNSLDGAHMVFSEHCLLYSVHLSLSLTMLGWLT